MLPKVPLRLALLQYEPNSTIPFPRLVCKCTHGVYSCHNTAKRDGTIRIGGGVYIDRSEKLAVLLFCPSGYIARRQRICRSYAR